MRDDGSPVLFVSHHSSKLQTAEHVEKALSARGVKCWIAPRDVEPGEPFDRSVHKAIGDTDAMLLLFCSKSEKSRHVKRELILADQLDKAIIPLRLERIDPGELSYHLADSQWIDWLEQRDDVIDRIAAKAREFREEGHARHGDGAVLRPLGERSPTEWTMPRGGDERTIPVDLPDAAPSHSAAVGAAGDLQPHALGAFAGPGATALAGQPADQGAPGFGPGGYGYAGAPPSGAPAPGGRGGMMWVWGGLGAVVVVIAVVLAIVLGTRSSGGSAPAVAGSSGGAAPPTPNMGQPITAEWFAGVWSDSRDCRDPYRFDRSGQVTFPTGAQGRWRIEGSNILTVEIAGQVIRKLITRVGDDEITAPGEGSTYRCFPGAT